SRELADASRSLRREDYLLEQARRTRDDLWYDESDQAAPYNKRVAGAYLDDASEIDQALQGIRRKEIASIRADLSRSEAIRFENPSEVAGTSEEQAGLSYQVKAEDWPELRKGRALVWFEGDEPLEFEQPVQPARRQAVPLDGLATGALDVRLKFPKTSADT